MRKSPNPTAKALLAIYKELGQDNQAEFLRALENDMFKLHVSEVCRNEGDREILVEFAPESRDVKEMLLAPFRDILKTVREASKMAAFVVVKRPPSSTFRLALFFAEDPNLYDTLFQQEFERAAGVLHEFEFGRVIPLGSNPMETLRNIGIPITEWVRYHENDRSWSWEPF